MNVEGKASKLRPRNDKRTYQSLIRILSKSHPLVASVLTTADKNRTTRLSQYLKGARLQGFEELLAYLKIVMDYFHSNEELSRLSFLVKRADADFQTAIEAALTRLNGVLADAMRDVMEIELLFREFTHDPKLINEWLSADEKKLNDKFRPAILRQRQASRLKLKPQDLPESRDYKAHSMSLHVSPYFIPLAAKGFSTDQIPFEADSGFWEMFELLEDCCWFSTTLLKSWFHVHRVDQGLRRALRSSNRLGA